MTANTGIYSPRTGDVLLQKVCNVLYHPQEDKKDIYVLVAGHVNYCSDVLIGVSRKVLSYVMVFFNTGVSLSPIHETCHSFQFQGIQGIGKKVRSRNHGPT